MSYLVMEKLKEFLTISIVLVLDSCPNFDVVIINR